MCTVFLASWALIVQVPYPSPGPVIVLFFLQGVKFCVLLLFAPLQRMSLASEILVTFTLIDQTFVCTVERGRQVQVEFFAAPMKLLLLSRFGPQWTLRTHHWAPRWVLYVGTCRVPPRAVTVMPRTPGCKQFRFCQPCSMKSSDRYSVTSVSSDIVFPVSLQALSYLRSGLLLVLNFSSLLSWGKSSM